MIRAIKKSSMSMFIVLIFTFVILTVADAGSVLDRGQLTGIPAQANYIAWVPLFTPPHEILTEDGFNTLDGVNQGYQPDLIWRLNASNFTDPAAINNFFLNMIFGGLGVDSGTLWTYNFMWNNQVTETDHGIVGTQSSGTCPTMLQGSQDGTGKTINWSGASSQYLIYRSTLPSGADNGASNGRYSYVATIAAGTFTYLDTACPTGTECWHIVIPSASNVPTGCHSEESSPTAITLTAFAASSNSQPIILWVALGIAFLALGSLLILRRRQRA